MTIHPIEPSPAGDLARLRINRDAPPPRRWGLFLAAAVALTAMLAAGYPAARAYLAARAAPEVDVAPAVRLAPPPGGGPSSVPVLVASGYVIARRTTDVGVKVGGRLATLGVEEGDRVRARQIIARLEHADLDAQLVAARAAVDEAEARLAETIAARDEDRRALERQHALRRDGITTEAAVTAAEAAAEVSAARVRSADAALASARAGVRVVEEAIENTNVRAPFEGVVVAKRAEVGETVSPYGVAGQATREGGAIATIADLRDLEVETEVSETSVGKLRDGMAADVRLQAYPEVTYRAHLRQIFPQANRAKAIVEVRVTIDKPDERVKPEMTASVTFQETRRDLPAAAAGASPIVIPKRALAERRGAPHAWVVSGGRVTSRALALGPERLDMIEVTSGIAPGESVVVNPPDSLTDGAPVKIRGAR